MVQIITDSAADFEPRELEALGITCIPLTVIFNDEEYQENVNLSKERFYELLNQTQTLPKTAQASPQILIDLFENAVKTGDEAIYICLSSALSGTYQSALMAQQLVGSDRCFVLDSRNGTGGQRMVVEYALKLRGEGKTAAQIVSALEQYRDRIALYACMDTLENLYKGGRISHTTYKLGTLANIKPIISVDQEGRVQVPAKAMGLRRGMDWLCKQVSQVQPDMDFPFYVMYTDNRANGVMLAEKFCKMGIEVPDSRIIQVGAAIGTHIGPNAIGCVYIAKE
jgi:DegV family protein with EDD domain